MEYPKGAIKTVEELNAFAQKAVWKASRKFKSVSMVYFTGTTGQVTSSSKPGKEPYRFYEYSYEWSETLEYDLDTDSKIRGSLLDMNVEELNGYNDWFLFGSEEDARAYSEHNLDSIYQEAFESSVFD